MNDISELVPIVTVLCGSVIALALVILGFVKARQLFRRSLRTGHYVTKGGSRMYQPADREEGPWA